MQARKASDHDVWAYIDEYYKDEIVRDDFRRLANNVPGVVNGYIELRRDLFSQRDDGLSPKMKELIILAIEVATRKVNPTPDGFHTTKAVEAGASLQEIAEMLGLCIMISGMMSYQESGRFVLRAAEQLLAERGGEGA